MRATQGCGGAPVRQLWQHSLLALLCTAWLQRPPGLVRDSLAIPYWSADAYFLSQSSAKRPALGTSCILKQQCAPARIAAKSVLLPHKDADFQTPQMRQRHSSHLYLSNTDKNDSTQQQKRRQAFDLSTALFSAGLAFDAYVEPPSNSSRWERGSQGLQVAFVSAAYTRQLYKGLLELQIQQCTGLPPESEANAAEKLLSGSGVDACVLVAVVEGPWKEDVQMLEGEQYHTGVLDLSGAAHVTRSSTCWSSVDEAKAIASQKRNGIALPYYRPGKLWNNGATAVWPETEPPFYLYVQDPATARLVFTVLDDDKFGDGQAVGSTFRRLSELIPAAKKSSLQVVNELKQKVLAELQKTGSGGNDLDLIDQLMQKFAKTVDNSWHGKLPLTSKPRKRDKNSQILAGAAAGAAIAGPAGAAAGALLGNFYEGPVRGAIHMKIKYQPIPQQTIARKTYVVKGGMPGIDWGELYAKHQEKQREKIFPVHDTTVNAVIEETDGVEERNASKIGNPTLSDNETKEKYAPTRSAGDSLETSSPRSEGSDLEHCFFVSHQKTGATCAVYRSLEQKLIVVSFRGTCAPVDLVTDASLVQEAWVEGEDVDDQNIAKVHVGFRSSLNSIARRLKELILAVPAPGDNIADYDMLVTGHSLGGALATLFTADVGQYGIDAGRALPQLEPSEAWWKAVTNVFSFVSKNDGMGPVAREPPRPRSLRLYNFGSPRVGNVPFAEIFDALVDEGYIDQAYRIVNGEDVVARLPRSVNALVFGNINYDHVGTTVLLSQPEQTVDGSDTVEQKSLLWIEGESDDGQCPVRDGIMLSSPMAEGSLLSDLFEATRESLSSADEAERDQSNSLSAWTQKITSVAGKVTDRVKQMKASDLASVVGINKSFTDREFRIIQSFMQGKALAHHLEDEYYAGMGRATGYLARVGKDLIEIGGKVSV
jgi:Lipase (class 3)